MINIRKILKFSGCLCAGAVAGSLIFVLFFEIFEGFRLKFNQCFVSIYTGPIVSSGLFGAVSSGIICYCPMRRRQKILLTILMILCLPFIAMFGYTFTYEPIKFRYLIGQVESAKTADEERVAFILAKRWGCCWEIHLAEPPKDWLNYKELNAVVNDPKRTLVVELEWLESKPSGIPYRARRTLIEKTNIYILVGN